jgi:hypothetical protein
MHIRDTFNVTEINDLVEVDEDYPQVYVGVNL